MRHLFSPFELLPKLIPALLLPMRLLGLRFYPLILAAVIVLSPLPGTAAEQQATEPSKLSAASSAAPTTPVAIPLADIAAKAGEASILTSNLITSAGRVGQVEIISNSLPALGQKLDERDRETKETLKNEPTLEALQTLQQRWQRDHVETNLRLHTLTQHARTLQDDLAQLGALQQTWSRTRASAEASNAPVPILQQIDSTLSAISQAQEKFETERRAILNLQSRVAEHLSKCTAALAQIAQAQQTAVAGILTPDAPPIWRSISGRMRFVHYRRMTVSCARQSKKLK